MYIKIGNKNTILNEKLNMNKTSTPTLTFHPYNHGRETKIGQCCLVSIMLPYKSGLRGFKSRQVFFFYANLKKDDFILCLKSFLDFANFISIDRLFHRTGPL